MHIIFNVHGRSSLHPANREIGKGRPPRQIEGLPRAKREALFAPTEIGLGRMSRMYFPPQTHDLIGGRRCLGPFFHEVIFKRFCVKFGLLEMMGG